MTSKPSMNPALKEFWETKSRFKILYGGRASSKTWDTAAFAVFLSQAYRVKICCVRQFQNKIADSVFSTIVTQIERFGLLDQYIFTKNSIKHKRTGSEFLFYGIARNIKEIKGLEGVDILWIEEGEDVDEDSYLILEATIRAEHSQIWVVFNPKFATDFIYKHFVTNSPDDAVVRKINYTENPFISLTALKTANDLKARDYEQYQHQYLGVPLNDDDRVIIKRSWIESAIDAHTTLGISVTGSRRVGFDVADDGGDLNAMGGAYGILFNYLEQWKGREDELLQSCTRVWDYAARTNSSIDYDSIGVGATAGAKFKELNELRGKEVIYRKFNAGGRVIDPDKEYMPNTLNKDHFSNIKAQAWWLVADRLMETHAAVTRGEPFDPDNIISISSNIDHLDLLMDELSTPWRHFDNSGKVKVERKSDLAKRKVKSPNCADAFIMTYAPQEYVQSFNWGAV